MDTIADRRENIQTIVYRLPKIKPLNNSIIQYYRPTQYNMNPENAIYRKSHQWQLYLSLCVVPENISHRHKSRAKLKGKNVSLSIASPNK